MYASVEMLLKFCAENFFFKSTGHQVRAKRESAQTPPICNEENSRWLRRHFTRKRSADRIQFALLDSSTDNLLNFSGALLLFARPQESPCDETEKNYPLR
jgi:hypothetical protein